MRFERFSVYLILLSLPLYGVRFSLWGQPSHLLEVLILGAALVAAFRGISTETLRKVPAAVWLLLLAAVVGLFSAPDFTAAFASFRHFYVEPLLVVWLIWRNFAGMDDALRLLSALFAPALPIAFVAILQHYGAYPIPPVYQVEHRSTSLYSYANAVGLYLAPMIAGALGVLWYRFCVLKTDTRDGAAFFAKHDKEKIGFFVSVVLLSGCAIAFSQTESAWLALGVVLGIVGLRYTKTRIVTLVAGLGGLWFLMTEHRIAKLLLQKLLLWDFSGAVRRDMWRETVAFLREHWILGAGLAGYQARIAPYHTNPLIEIFWFPHNFVLNIWVELGILGIAAFVGLVVWYVRAARKVGAAHWIVTAAILTMLIHGLYDVPFFKPDLAAMTATLLVVVGIAGRGVMDRERNINTTV